MSIFFLLIHIWVSESNTKKYGSVQKGPSCPESVEGKAAATWTGGAYEGVREHGQGATCLRENAGNAAGLPAEPTPPK
jgi:hypothetical protein